MLPTVYLVRHATPDWSRTDLVYHLPPGPPLTAQGEVEAAHLGDFLRDMGVGQMLASPLERCLRTAAIAAETAGASLRTEPRLAEILPAEQPRQVLERVWPLWLEAGEASADGGPIALITHGGPISLLLAELGLDRQALERHQATFDRRNPLPPAGAWRAVLPTPNSAWALELAFTPDEHAARAWRV
jgi:broad specificity phosphatase PhoE